MNKGTKTLILYACIIAFFGLLMYGIATRGAALQSAAGTGVPAAQSGGGGVDALWHHLLEEVRSSIGLLLLQIIVILLSCRFFAWLFRLMHQPTVVGEILAGIVLGPSVLGKLAPGVSAFIFPPESLENIYILSMFGLVLFMFAIGMELDFAEVRKRWKGTLLISHASTIVPFFVGMLIAYFIYEKYAGETTPFLPFALFIGISMSITAFPVLARIIRERKMTRSHLGTLALSSAAAGDITAWFLLAFVIAISQAGSMASAAYSLLLSCLYLLFMFFPVRRYLRKVGERYENEEVINKVMVAQLFLVLIFSAYLTQILGLHALFGAFVAGVVMPENLKFRNIMTEKVEDVSLSLFLPLFFVSTGLRTQFGLLNTPELWLMCLVLIIGAIVGKFGGAFFSTRFLGESLKDSLYMGALMNTRGLMELVVLTIGYEMGILPPAIFVMLVIMTLVTTFMTAPLVSFIKFIFRFAEKGKAPQEAVAKSTFKLLLSFGRVSNGEVMLDLAGQLFSKGKKTLDITALHLTVGAEVNPMQADNFEQASFGPILDGARKLGLAVRTRYEVSDNPGRDIVQILNQGDFDFLLVGAGVSMAKPGEAGGRVKDFLKKRLPFVVKASESFLYPGALLRDKTKIFMEEAHCAVGVFINRNFIKAKRILVLMASPEEAFLETYARTLAAATNGTVTLRTATSLSTEPMTGYDFMLISYACWSDLSEHRPQALQNIPSTLILNK